MKLLKRAWSSWKRIAALIGRFQTRVMLTLFYFVVAALAWFFMRLFGKDVLARKTGKDLNYWIDYEKVGDGVERARHQF